MRHRSPFVLLLAGLMLGLIAASCAQPDATPLPVQDAPATRQPTAEPVPSTTVNESPLPTPVASQSGSGALDSPLPTPVPTLVPVAALPSPTPVPAPGEPETIFAALEPQHPSQRWGVPHELGTLFSATVDGAITSLRVYGAQTESGLHTARIWHWDSSQIVAGPFEWEYDGPGWHELPLPAPLEIPANTDYLVSVSTGTDDAYDFVSTEGGFDQPVLGEHLVTYSGSGLGSQTMGSMPAWQMPGNRSFFRDVVFVPGGVAAAIESSPPPETTVAVSAFYVATDGDDAWSGTLPAPNVAGTDGPWRTIQHAASTTQPGDTVYVRGGTYYEWVWFHAEDSGTEAEPKTFAAYPGEQVTLDGAVYPSEWQLHAGDIWWTDASDVDFSWEGQPRLVWQDDVWLAHSPDLGTMAEGSWWFDTETRYLYVWLRESGNPDLYEIAIATLLNAFRLDLASWIVLDGFDIVHYLRGVSQMDALADRGRHMEGLTVRNCTIGHVGEGIGLAGATFGTWGYTHRSRLERNVIYDTQSDAMWVGSGTGHYVRGNTISDVKQAWWRGFVSAAIILGNADDSVLEGNVIFDAHSLGIDVEHFWDAGYGNRNIIRGNRIYDVGEHGIAILGANETRIENNLLYRIGVFGVLVNTEAGPALGNQIVNNTFYDSFDRAIAVIEGSPGHSQGLVPQDTVIRNNIFSEVRYWGIFDEGQNTSIDYNLYWQNHEGLVYWQGTTYHTLAEVQGIGQEMHGMVGDPLLVSPPENMRLQQISPAMDIASEDWAPSRDYWGRARPRDGTGDGVAVSDIGAHEWGEPLPGLYLPLVQNDFTD